MPRSGHANNEFGWGLVELHRFLCVLVAGVNRAQSPFRCEQAHFFEWLTDGGNAGGGHGRRQYVIEADHGTIVRDFQTSVCQSAYDSEGSEIVECKDCSKRATRNEDLFLKTKSTFKA